MNRIYHPWYKWECYENGFFSKTKSELQEQICLDIYTNTDEFSYLCHKVITDWPYSCEHNLTNDSLNKVAWLGQACCAYSFKIGSDVSRSVFNLVPEKQQKILNSIAQKYIDIWEKTYEYKKNIQ